MESTHEGLTAYRMDGQVAVVTGAAGGLGEGIVERFASLGARVVLLDLSAALPRLKERAAKLPHGGVAIACDIADEGSVARAAEEVMGSMSACDILINNAGILPRHTSLQEMQIQDWDRTVSINLRGALLCTRAFGAQMLERGHGSIVNIASIAGYRPNASPAYSITKAGVLALTRHTAVEWGPRGVRTNSVSPGFIQTALSAGHYADVGLLKLRTSQVPVRRLGVVAEVASAVAYLASDAASFVNGQDLIVDGGFLETPLMHVQPKADQYGGYQPI